MEAVLRVSEPDDATPRAADDFDAWVAARGPALLRLAYVLTGNRADAEDAVQDALSRGCRAGSASVRSVTRTPTYAGWSSTRTPPGGGSSASASRRWPRSCHRSRPM